MNAVVVIFMRDTLRALGVKHVLKESFDVTPCVVRSLDDYPGAALEQVDLIVTDSDCFAAHMDFFLPRRAHTLIVSEAAGQRALSPTAGESDIIAALSAFVGKNRTARSITNSVLSQRETEVLRLIASGLISKEIADCLDISLNTVQTHRKNITAKLGIKSVSGLTFYAMMNGLVTPSQT